MVWVLFFLNGGSIYIIGLLIEVRIRRVGQLVSHFAKKDKVKEASFLGANGRDNAKYEIENVHDNDHSEIRPKEFAAEFFGNYDLNYPGEYRGVENAHEYL